MYDSLKSKLERFRGRRELAYALQMWDYALEFEPNAKTGTTSEAAGRKQRCNNALPYVPSEVLKKFVTLARGDTVLDVGCQGGYGLFDLKRSMDESGIELVGFDNNPDCIELAKALVSEWSGEEHVRLCCSSAEHLDMPDDACSLVIARLLLPYVDVKSTLREFNRVSQNGSLLLLQIHSYGYYWNQICGHMRDPRALVYYLRAILSGALFHCSGKQPLSPRWREVAISAPHMRKLCSAAGFQEVWRASPHVRPMMVFRKGGE